ncbi:hypothetical protein P4O66_020728 [Electrophorus voltai]|uniref:Protein phosphatase 1 regulatory subunit 35 C-terminal domain-containing protein n=2 Tax=Electrophorus TaxID=8004 RepID=A0A4W4EM74_ELEEL|nr:protein phosphatase 1 regulatory subunit 35 [Electrophorus electricus]KAK1803387.1 hypothetical protein P4O66_020728 [Electrophorus voltai]
MTDTESTAFGETFMELVPPPLPGRPATPPPQCPELDLSITLSLDQLELPERCADGDGVRERGRPHTRQRQVRFAVSPSCSVDQPLITTVIPQTCDNQSRAEKPNSKEKQKGRRGHHPTEVSDQSGTSLLEGAELNTTLALKAELRQLEEAEFDAQKAVQEKMQNSTLTRECIRVRASQGLNFPRSQHLYRALVSVSLSHDQLISQVLRDRPGLTPPTVTYNSKFHSLPAEGPDLFAFYSPQQLIRETPLLPGDQIPVASPCPVPRPSHATFHLHERHRQWDV